MNPSIVANSKWRYLLLLKLWNDFLKIPRIENGLNIHLTSSDPFFKRVEFPIHKSTIKLCLIKYQIHILFKTEYYQLCFLYKGYMMLQKPWRNCCNLTRIKLGIIVYRVYRCESLLEWRLLKLPRQSLYEAS